MHYVYVLRSTDSKDIYIGYSSNLRNRLKSHNKAGNTSTKNHAWILAYYEAYQSEIEARDRERKLKQYGKSLAMLKRRISKSLDTKGAG